MDREFKMKKEVLIVESDAEMTLTKALSESGYACAHASSARQALSLVDDRRFDLAVLDGALREVHAPELISLLHVRGRFPILVLSPVNGESALVAMLDAGAEDYLTRPFELRELIERMEIQLRRRMGAQPRGALTHKLLTLDPESFSVTLCGRPIVLTKQEFRILELMLLSPAGRVFTKQDFFDYAWDYRYAGMDKTVNVHICNIRKKIRAITDEQYIETIWGMGLRLV